MKFHRTRAARLFRNSVLLMCLGWMGAFVAAPSASAQLSTTGTINGTVTDPSGAIVAGAKISIVQTGTRTETETVSNSAGNFAQVGLNSGHYDVTISAPGFANFRTTDIYLGPMATFSVKAVLKPGNVSTTVTVSSSEAQVQTTTPEVSNTVTGEEAQELPLNGRNFEQLGSLMPGVINSAPVNTMGTGGYSTINTLQVNGGTITGSNGSSEYGAIYYLDGLLISSNVVHDQNIVTPNPDEITEVKALQNNFSAQYSLLGASAIVVQTKSGSDTFHGGAWEFLRNTDLNATQYFSHSPTQMDWNIFGYNLGGPLFIPKIYDAGKKRTFFYFNQQWVRQKAGAQATGAAPLAEMRGQGTPNGEFLFPGEPAGYSAYVNAGTLPTPGIGGPFGTAYMTDPSLPANHCSAKTKANPTGSTTSCFPQDANGNWIIPANRIDPNALTLLNAMVPLPNNLAGGAYSSTSSNADYLNTNPNITDQVDLFGKVDHELTSKLRLSGEYMVEEQTFTGANAARYGSPWTTNYDIFATDDQAFQVRLTQLLSATMTNQTSASIGLFDGTHDFGGLRMLSQVPGFHQTLPYGGTYLQNYLPNVQFSAPWSKFGTSSNYIVPRATELHNTVTDDWSWLHGKHFVQAGATLLLGTERHWASPVEVQGHFTFNGYATGNSMSDYLLGMASSFNQMSSGIRTIAHYKIASPYVEDTWHVSRRVTISGGLRYSYMPWAAEQPGVITDFNPAAFDPAKAPTLKIDGTITSAPGTYDPANGIILNGANGVPLNLSGKHKNYWSPVAGFAWDVYGDGKTSVRGGYGLTYYETASQGCNEGICQGYPTINQTNLSSSNFDNPAGASPAPTIPNERGIDLNNYRASHIHTYSVSLEQQFGSSWIASIAGAGSKERAGSASIDINQPGPVTQNGVTYDFNPNLNVQGYVAGYYGPYQGYGTITYYENIGLSNWDALELSLKHHTTKNLYLTAAYTWSHGMDNFGGIQNSRNIAAAYGNSGFDIPQVFTVSAIYYLPRLEHSRLWMKEVLGGWQYSDMTTLQSGGATNVGLSGANLGLASRPNQIAPITYSKNWRNPTNTWFSPSSFVKPAQGYFGNARNGIIRQPGVEVFNMALYKTFPFTERVHLQFRAEFFNVFNHSNPNGPNTTVGNSAIGTITGEKEAREGQGSLKLTF